MMKTLAALALGLAGASLAHAQSPALPKGWTVDRVVVVMRHGVRPPTKAVPLPTGTAADPWPAWPVEPGYLTPHGAAAIALAGDYDRSAFVAARLLPATGCPRAGQVRVIADSDERTIATAAAYVTALTPACTQPIAHAPQDVPDARFSPVGEGGTPIDPALAAAAVRDAVGPAGLAGVEAGVKPILERIDAILCGAAKTGCGIATTPTAIVPATATSRPKLKGALDRGSTAAQILLLEYADGKPMAEVGWGRATPADITRASALHALEFRLLARPAYLAARNSAGLAPLIADALRSDAPGAPAIVAISGHDTNVASLAALFDLHWSVPGFATDDPAPGGAIVLERLTDRTGQHRIRIRYRAPTLDQIRNLTGLNRSNIYDRAASPTPCIADAALGCPMAQVLSALTASR